ncbi:MAG TPA: hypothetical protein DD811_02245 [Syntrophomonas sp.]|jgi:hypothetical protein|nr:hypothetical protein [Syntrophomonas sp.]
MNLNEVTAQINEGRRLINDALALFNKNGIWALNYDYKDNSVQIASEEDFLKMFPTYVITPRDSEYYPTTLITTHQGIEFFALSKKPFPKDGTSMICVSRPTEEAI